MREGEREGGCEDVRENVWGRENVRGREDMRGVEEGREWVGVREEYNTWIQ